MQGVVMTVRTSPPAAGAGGTTTAERRDRIIFWFLLRRSLPALLVVLLYRTYALSLSSAAGGGKGTEILVDARAMIAGQGPVTMEDFHGRSRKKRDDGRRRVVDSMRPYVKKERTPEQRRAAAVLKPRTRDAIFRCRPRRELSVAGAGSSGRADPARHAHRLVFVHVFKTAGSTMREFFADYSRRCSAGWAVLIGCTRLNPDSLLGYDDGGGTWRARKAGKHAGGCIIKKSVSRADGLEDGNWTKVMGSRLAEEFDMFGGHLPLGTGSVWGDMGDGGGLPRVGGKLTYVAFFRNAVSKYLSGISFVTQAGRPPKAMAHIKDSVPGMLARGQYQCKFADYLVTPQQHMVDRIEGRTGPRSNEEQALRVMMNLLKFDVIVGLTERMSDSLRMLEALMDEEGDATDIFDKYGREREGLPTAFGEGTPADSAIADAGKGGNSTGTRKANQSKLSTADLMKAVMEERPLLFADILEYTKYEQQITDFALALHTRQMKSFGIESWNHSNSTSAA
mmetsp:Transcript_47517/g.143791  ORF Transcript_47517/g.143791 Transcript_47517/m.143791 type:complete len:508 (-) Transcript_47517:1110-2633(-)